MSEPIFLFSPPRSGSTLLQRILSAQSDIASVAEPWLLLPLLYSIREDGVFAEYSHLQARSALMDFLKELPQGRNTYLQAVNKATSFLYAQAARNGERYFLDKTPRYALIANEILEAFPSAKVIFLWRNPLAIAASMVQTWGEGKWNLFRFNIDLYEGVARLVEGFQSNAGRSLSVQYESLLLHPERELARISEYLTLDISVDVLRNFSSVTYGGKMGDPTGTKQYTAIASEPLGKWKAVICNPLRKNWCRRYLLWLGESRLNAMGYSLSVLLSELEKIKVENSRILGDIGQIVYGSLLCALELPMFKRKYKTTATWEALRLHD